MKKLTFDLLLDWFGRVQPMTDMVVVRELQAKVVFLNDVHLIMNLLQQFLTSCLFLNSISFVTTLAIID